MSVRALVCCWCLVGALPMRAQDAVVPPSPTSSDAASAPGEVTTPAEAPAPVPAADAVPPATEPPAAAAPSPAPPPSPPPEIADLAVAADSPTAAPVISLTVEPVDSVATLWWRGPGAEWVGIEMVGSGTALRLARLPDGLQRRGFAFYVDVVGRDRRARFGSRAAPVEVPPAIEGNVERVERNDRDAAAWAGPHPALVMMALGTGVLTGAGAGAFAYDLAIVQNRIAAVDAAIAAAPAGDERTALEAERTGLDRAALQDTTAAALLGVVAGVATVTGVTLLVVGALEQ